MVSFEGKLGKGQFGLVFRILINSNPIGLLHNIVAGFSIKSSRGSIINGTMSACLPLSDENRTKPN